MDQMLVSIVIPAYNEARRLPRTMARLSPFVRDLGSTEVIIVDDGSSDGTGELAARCLRDVQHGRLVRLPWNSGKGTAVRVGVALARGRAIVFMDADMASDIEDLPKLLAALQTSEVALGSRRLGHEVSRSNGRKVGSWAFNRITRSIVDLNITDTQCGFKAFRHAEAKVLFGMSRATGFGFDVEVLTLARSCGYRIAEVPVGWSEMDGGTFRLVRHTPSMIYDVVRARKLLRRTPLAQVRTMAPARAMAPVVPIGSDPPVPRPENGRNSAREAGMPSAPREVV